MQYKTLKPRGTYHGSRIKLYPNNRSISRSSYNFNFNFNLTSSTVDAADAAAKKVFKNENETTTNTLDNTKVNPLNTEDKPTVSAKPYAPFLSLNYWFSTKEKPSAPPVSKKSSSKGTSISSNSSNDTTAQEGNAPTEDSAKAPSTSGNPPQVPATALWKKFAAIIPLVGEISTYLNQKALDQFVAQHPEKDAELKAWKLKRVLNGLSIARSMIEIAIVAKLVALTVLGINAGVAIGAVPVILFANYIYRAIQDHKTIKKMEQPQS